MCLILRNVTKQHPNADGDEDAETRAENKRVQILQSEVHEVAVILHTTVDKLLERGEKLDDLMDDAGIVGNKSFVSFVRRLSPRHLLPGGWLPLSSIGCGCVLLSHILIFCCPQASWTSPFPMQ